MAIIKCKMCGGDLRLEEGSTVCECEYCGTRQTVPSADNEKKLTLFSRAGRLLRGCEFDKAAGVFETIVADFPEEAEAYWGLVLCKYGIEYVDDPATGKKIPTCHRSSFDSVLDDPNYEQACENTDAVARRVYRDEARQIEDLRKQIIEVSGKEEPYDVFISYKETDENGDRTLDSVIAQDIYTELTEKGYRVFFSRISLEDKLGTEYEPYIFAALNSAKVMLVVGTDYENYDAVWVKNEWSRFLKLIASGQKKTLIPVFKNMDAYDMPKEFAKLAAQDMGKVGAMQDLVRGVEKLIGIKKTEPAAQQPVFVSNEADAKTAAAVKRGFMALEDSEWSKAKEYFDQALTLDAECAEAYLGLALADEQCANEDTYISRRCAILPEQETKSLSPNWERVDAAVKNYVLPNFLDANEIRELFKFDLTYSSSVKGTQKIAEQEKNSFRNNRNLTRAIRFSKGETKSKLDAFQSSLFTKLDNEIEKAKKQEAAAREQKTKEYEMHLEAAEQRAAELRRAAEEKREAAYQSACKWQSEATTVGEYQNIMNSFVEFQDYRDSSQRIEQCRAAIEDLNEKARLQAKAAAEEAERKRLLQERADRTRKARKKRIAFASLFAVALAVAAYFIYTNVIVPANNYKAAEVLYATEQYEDAIAAFTALEGYKDSTTRIEEAREALRVRNYAAAEVLLKEGNYEKAISVFEALGDYKDSAERLNETRYAAAEALLEAGQYNEAIAAFETLGDYKDSEGRIEEVIRARDYAAAEALFEAGRYEEAYAEFVKLKGYKDVNKLLAEDNNLIAAAVAVARKEAFMTVGNKVSFGTYEQDNNTANGKEEIEWVVLATEGDRSLLISKYALDCQMYNKEFTSVTWETCTLRKWLNETFLNTAFSAEERGMIPKTTVNADKNPAYRTSPGKSTEDPVFLLSISEVKQYFGSDTARQCKPTAYTKAQGCDVNSNTGFCSWWLRSPGANSSCATRVNADGTVDDDGNIVDEFRFTVRPALWVDFG